MGILYTLSYSTSTISNIPINIEPYKPLYNEQENISIKVPRCCENCPNRPTKDHPMRVCLCVLPTLEQIKW